jgi:branched-chain amino acid transport system ATP-binding protein
MDSIRSLSAHTTVLLVEQNFRMASQLADYYYLIDDGKSIQHGAMQDLVKDRATIQRYLGAAQA